MMLKEKGNKTIDHTQLVALDQICQTQARGVIIFGPRDNFKHLLELARQYIVHASLILQILECFASALARQSRPASSFC